MHGRYEGLREAADQTYKWILDPDPELDAEGEGKRDYAASFLNWFRCGSGLFWVSGKPGSGKSTLMKYLAEHIALEDSEFYQPDLAVLSFFFWIKGDDLQRSMTGCMRSLLWQLLQNPSTMTLAIQTCDLHFKGAWTESVLRKILSAILKDTEHSMAIFIDGLDESNDHDEVLAFLSMFECATRVKTCVSSRPEAILVDTLRSCENSKLQDLNSADIQKVIKHSFLGNTRVLALAAKLTAEHVERDFEDLGRTSEHKSEGVFLWVHLVIKDLLRGITQRDDLSTLSQRLHRLPNDIYALYKDTFQRTRHDHELYKDRTALYLVLALHRDFNVIDFCFAVNENLRKKYLCSSIFDTKAHTDLGAEIDCETVVAQVHTYTAGLLEVRDRRHEINKPTGGCPLADRYPSLLYKHRGFIRSYIQFVHRTAVDFLRNTTEGNYLTTVPSSVEAQVKHVCRESSLIVDVVLPGILGQCVPGVYVGWHIARCGSCEEEDVYNALKQQGMFVLNPVRSAGLLLPDRSTWVVAEDGPMTDYTKIASPFPSSEHAHIDLAPILTKFGMYRAAKMWLDDHACGNDKQYLTGILIMLLRQFLQGPLPPHAGPLLKGLLDSGADLHQTLTTQIGEVYRPIVLIVLNLTSIRSHNFQEVNQFLGLTKADLSVKPSPCCFDCHQVWHEGYFECSRFEFWGTFFAVDFNRLDENMKDLLMDSQILQPDDNRVFVISSLRVHPDLTRVCNLWAVSEEDSQLLAAMFGGNPSFFGVISAPGIFQVDFQIEERGDRCESFINMIDAICARSRLIIFAAAMERLGKSQETIRKFYEGEAERMAHEHPWRQKGWKQWFWGNDAPPGVEIDPDERYHTETCSGGSASCEWNVQQMMSDNSSNLCDDNADDDDGMMISGQVNHEH